MTTKETLLALLLEQPGTYLSGEELADTLQVSRTSVWKAVKALKAQGYAIQAVTNRGYCLDQNLDVPDLSRIRAGLQSPLWKPEYAQSVTSTNSLLRDRANAGAPEGTVLLAGTQTGGRGRMGRQFFSPQGTGLYLSLLLRPQNFTPDQALQLTTMTAAALCQAITSVTGLEPGIKWVNDLFYEGKKICGILTEAAFNLEAGSLDYAVVGLGLNLYPPKGGFPEPLSSIAGSLLRESQAETKNRIVTDFLNRFGALYENCRFREAGEIYRAHSLLIGKQVLVEGRQAEVLDVTDRCQLLVRYADGKQQALSYGEVSIVNPNNI